MHTGVPRKASLNARATGGRRRGQPTRAGFSLIELTVVIGVVMILVALMLPSIGGVMRRAKLVRATARSGQIAAMVLMYSADRADAFPAAAPLVMNNSYGWEKPLIDAGYFADKRAVDPDGMKFGNEITHLFSVGLLADPKHMVRGATLPWEGLKVARTRVSDVTYPDAKGMLDQFYVPYGNPPGNWWCCLSAQPVAPVAFVGGAVQAGRWTEFIVGDELYTEDSIGSPVFTTWGGVQGRDR
jgi:type II secretory pathway pseudopilin PulG